MVPVVALCVAVLCVAVAASVSSRWETFTQPVGVARWATNTVGPAGETATYSLCIKPPGNLVMERKTAKGTAVHWQSNTATAAALRVGTKGAELVDGGGVVVWPADRAPSGRQNLQRNQSLVGGECISLGQHRLCMQRDGNLVWYDGATARWASNTASAATAAYTLTLQTDGNLVIYRKVGSATAATWASHTNNGSSLTVGAAGAQLKSSTGAVVWPRM